MRFSFKIVHHRHQRYPTVGDWTRKAGVWHFRISRFKDKRYSWLVFLHEFIEWALCYLAGIKPKQVDRFDMAYEQTREGDLAPCGCRHFDECGDDPHAPYFDAHQVATACEKLIAKALRVQWSKYEEEISKL